MTALNFLIEADRVCVLMDTLVSAADDKQPAFFASKILLLPHLRSVLCGTGTLPFILDWFVFVQSNVLGYDIRILAEIGAQQLPQLWKKYVSDYPSLTTTIYHFGWDVLDSRFRAFRHDSKSTFIAAEIAYGCYMKPEITNPPELLSLPAGFIELTRRQRQSDATNLPKNRLGIGGELHFLVLTQDSLVLEVCHRFEDFETTFKEMLGRLRGQPSAGQR